jgi:hypothetical protein
MRLRPPEISVIVDRMSSFFPAASRTGPSAGLALALIGGLLLLLRLART